MLAQEPAELGCDTLNDRINGEDDSVRSLNRVAREKIENQQPNAFIVIRTVRQLLVTLASHQFVQRGLGRGNPFDGGLGSNDDWFAMVQNDALQPDVIVEQLVLQRQPVEIFSRGCSSRIGSQRDAVTQLTFQQGGLEIALRAPVEINLMLAATGEFRRQPSARR